MFKIEWEEENSCLRSEIWFYLFKPSTVFGTWFYFVEWVGEWTFVYCLMGFYIQYGLQHKITVIGARHNLVWNLAPQRNHSVILSKFISLNSSFFIFKRMVMVMCCESEIMPSTKKLKSCPLLNGDEVFSLSHSTNIY